VLVLYFRKPGTGLDSFGVELAAGKLGQERISSWTSNLEDIGGGDDSERRGLDWILTGSSLCG